MFYNPEEQKTLKMVITATNLDNAIRYKYCSVSGKMHIEITVRDNKGNKEGSDIKNRSSTGI